MDPDSRCLDLYSDIFSSYFSIAVKMKTVANEAFQKRVISYFENVAQMSKIKTVRHFTSEGKSRSTIYKIITRYQASKRINYTQSIGRPATVGTPRLRYRALKI